MVNKNVWMDFHLHENDINEDGWNDVKRESTDYADNIDKILKLIMKE